MSPSMLLPIVLLCFFVVPDATSLVTPAIPHLSTSQIQSRKDHLVRLDATTRESNPTTASAKTLFQPDPDVDAPLPPVFTDCPFTGILGGPDSFYRKASQALQSPRLFSFTLKDQQPVVEVTGGSNIRTLLQQEFTNLTSNAIAGVSQLVCGMSSLRTATDKTEHRALRGLIGVPLSPAAVAAAVPRLETICRQQIQATLKDKVSKNKNHAVVRAVDITTAMALDVTWQQVLGLDLQTQAEIDIFHAQTYTWLRGIYSRPGSPELQATLEAREYLVQAVQTKIERLRNAGQSDGSTVGGLVFATMDDVKDDNNDTDLSSTGSSTSKRSLSNEEIVDNALLLILAATETTSSNLANVIMLMGMHPDVWQKVVDEQRAVVTKFGQALTPEILNHHVPYLEAVLQETLRILPVTLVSRRETTQTIVLDGQQIPKGWGVNYNIFLTHQNDASLEPNGNNHTNHMDLMEGFQPSRWLSKQTQPSHQDYIPFGAGPRKCPGITLAMTEMKSFLAMFARSIVQYELVMRDDLDFTKPVDEQITWKQLNAVPIPEDGVRIRILK
eukprot:scaffold4223_cov189-Amphora_coffeaeformis.AAC.1